MLEKIAEKIRESERIFIFPHKSVDGDCLGSSYALKLALLNMGKQAEVIIEPTDSVNRYTKLLKDATCDKFTPDLMVAVDCGDLERLGTRKEMFETFADTVNIDHHGTNPGYAKLNHVDPDAAAAGELVYKLLIIMGAEITADIAFNLYTAISSDTGSFAYSNTTPQTHEIAGELIKTGINFPYINSYLFATNTLRELKLAEEALKTLETVCNGKIASVTVTKEVIEKYNVQDSELGGLVDYPKSLDTARIALYFKEKDNGVKVRFRSKGDDVAKIAVKFGGGGHVRASGCFIEKPLAEVKKLIYAEAEAAIGG